MSFYKIPFIIAAAVGIHCSITSPSQPPSLEEKVMHSTASESFVGWFLGLYGLELIKASVWAASFAEVACIFAAHADPSQITGGIYGTRVAQSLLSLQPTPITPAFLASSLAVAFGGACRLYCSLTLGKFWSFSLSIRKEHRLVTSGPYSVVRHPSYTAYLLQYLGIMTMYGSQGSWMRESGILQAHFVKVVVALHFFLFTFVAYIAIRRVPLEDKMLHRALGDEWEDWAKRVKYRLLPGVY